MLKYTGVQLDIFTEPEPFLMIESGMRGGITSVSKRKADANNEFVGQFDKDKPRTFISYLDMNNLYGHSMSQVLPRGNFRYLGEAEVAAFDVQQLPDESNTGYIIECDLHYPAHLHDLHNDYPLAPEHLLVEQAMLSPHAQSYAGMKWKPSEKLVPNLRDKTNYVVPVSYTHLTLPTNREV